MAKLLLQKTIANKLSRAEIKKLKTDYLVLLHKNPFQNFDDTAYSSVIRILKRDKFTIGPYTEITIFEAANRIASDLTLLEGVLKLFDTNKISSSATVQLRLGTMHSKNKGDFSVFENGFEFQGEAFDVAFLNGKLYTTLANWSKKEEVQGCQLLKYVVFNENCLEDSSSRTYFKNQQEKYPDIIFAGVKSWH